MTTAIIDTGGLGSVIARRLASGVLSNSPGHTVVLGAVSLFAGSLGAFRSRPRKASGSPTAAIARSRAARRSSVPPLRPRLSSPGPLSALRRTYVVR